jgi:hypothetical protein
MGVAVRALGTGVTEKKAQPIERLALEVDLTKTKVFASRNMSDLDELAVGDYALPMITEFPAIDTFGVVAGTRPWGVHTSPPQPSTGGSVTLLLLQMTASMESSIGHHVVPVIDKVTELLGKEPNRVLLVFSADSGRPAQTARPRCRVPSRPPRVGAQCIQLSPPDMAFCRSRHGLR